MSYDFDVFTRIGKTTIDEDHIGDFARGGFTWPVGIAISKTDGRVFASDEYECNISVFDPDAIQPFCERDEDGEYIGRWGTKGSEPGMLNGPAGLAFDEDDNLHVVDSLNNRVQVFSKCGDFLRTWGSGGTFEGEFNRPWGITIDREGAIYVADWGNHRVQKFSPDGQHLMTFGSQNGSTSSLSHPAGVAVDSDGDVYVTDWGNRRVQIFEPHGDVVTALYGDMRELSKAGQYALERDPESIKRLNQYDDADRVPQQVLQTRRHRNRRPGPRYRNRRHGTAGGVSQGPRLPGTAALGLSSNSTGGDATLITTTAGAGRGTTATTWDVTQPSTTRANSAGRAGTASRSMLRQPVTTFSSSSVAAGAIRWSLISATIFTFVSARRR